MNAAFPETSLGVFQRPSGVAIGFLHATTRILSFISLSTSFGHICVMVMI